MELIDRYLQAVKFALPKDQRDDIVKELSANLLALVEERQSELGRPLSEEEQVALLRQFGNPAALAGRYRKQQYLIGPGLFPIYRKVLSAALIVGLIVLAIACIAAAAAGRPLLTSLAPLWRYPAVALTIFAWVTLLFAAGEFFGASYAACSHSAQRWDPRSLPALVKVEHGQNRTELIAALVLGTVGTVWWLAGLRNPFLIFGPGVAFIAFGPVWLRIYPLFVVAGLAEVARCTVALAWPHAMQLQAWVRLFSRGVGLVVLGCLIKAGEIFVVADAANFPRLETLMGSINYWSRFALIASAIVVAATMVTGLVRMAKGKINHAHHVTMAW